MNDEGTRRLVALKRKSSRVRKREDILKHRQVENDINVCHGSPYYLPEKLGNKPLRCVFVGLNPSEVAWKQGE